MTIALANTGLVSGTWNIDPSHSTVGFTVRHLVVSKVRGTFDDFTGAITIAEDGTPSVVADIKVDSVNTRNEGRDEHLKNADFFEAEKFPVANFRSTSVAAAKGGDYTLTGDFTLHGVTKEIEMNLESLGVNPGMGHGSVAGFEATAVINRRDFGISIELPLEGGGAVVGDKINLHIEIEAGLQA